MDGGAPRRCPCCSNLAVTDVTVNTFSVFGFGKIVEILNVTDDFEADVFILSEQFQKDLSISELLSLKVHFNTSPTIALNKETMEALTDYHRMAARIIQLEGNPYKWQSLLCLTQAFYYGGGYYIFKNFTHAETNDSIVTRFMLLVEQYAVREREIPFFADKLCLTPKYLSKLIQKKTGHTAKDVISHYVLLQSRALLLNTDYNIQQISDMLHFPSQSVFGKFFKQGTGLSPKQYRDEFARN